MPSSVIDRIIEVPQSVSPVGEQAEGHQFLFLEDIIAAYADRFFLGCDILEVAPFRITRDADLAIDDDVEDLLVEVEKSLKKRRKGAAVRLELAASWNTAAYSTSITAAVKTSSFPRQTGCRETSMNASN